MDSAWHTLASECTRIQRRIAVHHHAVQRHLFTWLHHNHAANGHLIRIHLHQLSLLLHVGIIRTDVHQFGNIASTFTNSDTLKQFSNLVKQHHRHRFGIVTTAGIHRQHHSANRCYRHQKTLVEHLAVFHTLRCFQQNVVAHQKIRYHVANKTQHALKRQKMQPNEEHQCR